jgi:hypothetical protein
MGSATRCLTATYNVRTNEVFYCELPILENTPRGYVISDGDGDVLLSELDAFDCAATTYEANESVDDVKAELEERLRLRLAHWNCCHPNIPLKRAN